MLGPPVSEDILLAKLLLNVDLSAIFGAFLRPRDLFAISASSRLLCDAVRNNIVFCKAVYLQYYGLGAGFGLLVRHGLLCVDDVVSDFHALQLDMLPSAVLLEWSSQCSVANRHKLLRYISEHRNTTVPELQKMSKSLRQLLNLQSQWQPRYRILLDAYFVLHRNTLLFMVGHSPLDMLCRLFVLLPENDFLWLVENVISLMPVLIPIYRESIWQVMARDIVKTGMKIFSTLPGQLSVRQYLVGLLKMFQTLNSFGLVQCNSAEMVTSILQAHPLQDHGATISIMRDSELLSFSIQSHRQAVVRYIMWDSFPKDGMTSSNNHVCSAARREGTAGYTSLLSPAQNQELLENLVKNAGRRTLETMTVNQLCYLILFCDFTNSPIDSITCIMEAFARHDLYEHFECMFHPSHCTETTKSAFLQLEDSEKRVEIIANVCVRGISLCASESGCNLFMPGSAQSTLIGLLSDPVTKLKCVFQISKSMSMEGYSSNRSTRILEFLATTTIDARYEVMFADGSDDKCIDVFREVLQCLLARFKRQFCQVVFAMVNRKPSEMDSEILRQVIMWIMSCKSSSSSSSGRALFWEEWESFLMIVMTTPPTDRNTVAAFSRLRKVLKSMIAEEQSPKKRWRLKEVLMSLEVKR